MKEEQSKADSQIDLRFDPQFVFIKLPNLEALPAQLRGLMVESWLPCFSRYLHDAN